MKNSALEAFFSSMGINPEYISPMSKLTSGSESILYSANCESHMGEDAGGQGLTGCGASEISISIIGGTVITTRDKSFVGSFMHSLIGLVLTSARYVTKTGMFGDSSDVKDQCAQCEQRIQAPHLIGQLQWLLRCWDGEVSARGTGREIMTGRKERGRRDGALLKALGGRVSCIVAR